MCRRGHQDSSEEKSRGAEEGARREEDRVVGRADRSEGPSSCQVSNSSAGPAALPRPPRPGRSEESEGDEAEEESEEGATVSFLFHPVPLLAQTQRFPQGEECHEH